MIISDLSHFTEAAEAPGIVGGDIFSSPLVQYSVTNIRQYSQSLALATAILGNAKAKASAFNFAFNFDRFR